MLVKKLLFVAQRSPANLDKTSTVKLQHGTGQRNSTAASVILSSKPSRFTNSEVQVTDERRRVNSRISNDNFLPLKDDNEKIHTSAVILTF